MNEALLRAFLDDCKDAPLDDTPRLILADWLQDAAETPTDRARAEYLRLAVLARSCLPGDPLFVELLGFYDRCRFAGNDFLSALRVRLDLRVEPYQGLASIGGLPGSLLSRAVNELARTPAWHWVESVTLDGNDPRLGRVLDRLWLASVARLRILAYELTPFFGPLVGSECLGGLRSLTVLTTDLDDSHLTQFASWPTLSRLHELAIDLAATQSRSFAGWPLVELRRLELRYQSDTGLNHLLRSPHLTQLRELVLTSPQLTAWTLISLRVAPLARGLVRLDTSTTPLGDDGASLLADAEFPALRRLNLARCRIGATGVERLAQAPWLTGLESLDLSHNAAWVLEPITRLPLTALRHLNLAATGLASPALHGLRDSPHLNRLEILQLQGNHLGAWAADLFSRGDAWPVLRVLNLESTSLGNGGFRALAKWPGLSRLLTVQLAWHDVTEADLRELLRADPVASIRLVGMPPSPELVELAEALA